jgi:methylmalonyl-CoA mutase
VGLDASILDEAFTAASFADWERAALKAAKTDSLQALHSAFEAISIAPLEAARHDAQPIPMRRPGWTALQRVDDPDVSRAATQAGHDIEDGADGLALVFAGAHNAFGRGLPPTEDALNKVLDGINLERIAIRIDAHPAVRKSAEWLVRLIERRKPDTRKLKIAIGIDHASILAATGRLGLTREALAASLPQSLSGFFASGLPGTIVEADGRIIRNAGGSVAQELAFALSIAVGHLRLFDGARQPVSYAINSLAFSLTADQDVIATIAKLRALRLLWGRVLDAGSLTQAQPLKLHVETAFSMMSARDAETNILRNALALSAAAIGGAESISVLPHTIALGLPDAAARRLALTAQLVARDESHLGRVADMAAGSGAVEHLTEQFYERAWAEFQKIESEGGALSSLVEGKLQGRVTEARAARSTEATTKIFVGVNAFQASEQRPQNTLPFETASAGLTAALKAEALVPQTLEQANGLNAEAAE